MSRIARLLPVTLLAVVLAGCANVGGNMFKRDLPTQAGTVNAHEAARILTAYRASRGLGPVSVSPTLNRIAADHARKMAAMNRMAHVLPGQGSFKKRISSGGYRAALAAENVGAGYQSLETAMKRWQASPSHDRNLLNPQIKEIGIAVAHAPGSRYGSYWALVLADPFVARTASLAPQPRPDLMVAVQ